MTSAERAASLYDRIREEVLWHTTQNQAADARIREAWVKRVTAAIDAAVAEALDCGQDGVCANAPGCARHWEERNRELAALVPRWVPVGERLPETNEECVVTLFLDAEHVSRIARFSGDEQDTWWVGDREVRGVLAWQPLPAPWVAP